MAAEVVDFDERRITPYLVEAIGGFLTDPPDTDYQRGYLAALVSVYREGLGREANDARLVAAERLLR